MAMLEAKVDGLALDMTTNTPVVVLAPVEAEKVLPIWIGHAEAWGIAMQLSGVKSKRPMTYDLMGRIIETMQARVDRVEVTELKEQTFYAVIHVSRGDESFTIDARPSDSIALALKMEAPIMINEDLLNLDVPEPDTGEEGYQKPSESQDEPGPGSHQMPTDPESLRERLKRINPEDFGKYSL
ncbi:bifunctional nuclease family protein [candidate division GN15 bacterium]|nr:bifunctional nuclease family protein [candidate division GN15 bacterium]